MAHNELRPFRVDVYDLQDHFIKTIKDVGIELKGEIESLSMTISDDGTQQLSFNLPMFIRKNGELVANPLWKNVEDNTLLINLRKIKIIFNPQEGYNNDNVFEFIINKITEEHSDGILTCKVESTGLAFQELGKTGYKLSFSLDSYMLECEEALDKGEEMPRATINYWMDKVVDTTAWDYKVDIKYDSSIEGRDDDKIYEDPFVVGWDNNDGVLQPAGYSTYTEKERIIDCSNSNRYNITQTIAETFEVKCKYVYVYDDNCHIIGRKMVFFNEIIADDPTQILDINYFFNASNITRTNDSTDIITKLYVTPVEDNDMELSIIDVGANKSGEDYILNFDYLYEAGAITDEQYEEVGIFENKVGILNKTIQAINNKIISYTNLLNEAQAQYTISEAGAATNYQNLNDLRFEVENYENIANGELSPTKNTSQKLIKVTDSTVPVKAGFERCKYSFTALGLDVDSITETNAIDESLLYRIDDPDFENPQYNMETGLCSVYFYAVPPKEDDGSFGGFTELSVDYQSDLTASKRVGLNVTKAAYNKNIADMNEAQVNIDYYTEKLNIYDEDYSTEEEPKGLLEIYQDKLAEKKELVARFEHFMGPALREGSWSDDNFMDTGNRYEASDIVFDIEEDFDKRHYINGTSNVAFWKWDTNTFSGEFAGFYNSGTDGTRIYYPYFPLSDEMISALQDNDATNSFQLRYGQYWQEMAEDERIAKVVNSFKNDVAYDKNSATNNPYKLNDYVSTENGFYKYVRTSNEFINIPPTNTGYWTAWPYKYSSSYSYAKDMVITHTFNAPSVSEYIPISQEAAAKDDLSVGKFFSSSSEPVTYELIYTDDVASTNSIPAVPEIELELTSKISKDKISYHQKQFVNVANVPSPSGNVSVQAMFCSSISSIASKGDVGDLIAFCEPQSNLRTTWPTYRNFSLNYKQITDIQDVTSENYHSDNSGWYLLTTRNSAYNFSATGFKEKWVKLNDVNFASSNFTSFNIEVNRSVGSLVQFIIENSPTNIVNVNVVSYITNNKLPSVDSFRNSSWWCDIKQYCGIPKIPEKWSLLNETQNNLKIQNINEYDAKTPYKYKDYIKFTQSDEQYIAHVSEAQSPSYWPETIPENGVDGVFVPVDESKIAENIEQTFIVDEEWSSDKTYNIGDPAYKNGKYYKAIYPSDANNPKSPTTSSVPYIIGLGAGLEYGIKHWDDDSQGEIGDPILYITDTTALAQLDDANLRTIFDANPELFKVSTFESYKPINPEGGLSSVIVNNFEEQRILKIDSLLDTIEDKQVYTPNVTENMVFHSAIYPRIGVESMFMKVDDSSIALETNDTLLEKYSDYIGPIIRTNELEDENYYDSYYITPKYATILKYYDNGISPFDFKFVLANGAEHIYMDALKVSKENAYPQVSYTVDVAATNSEFLKYSYKKLSNVCNINDYMLQLNGVRGYISSITISPAAPWEDSFTVNNYKTKFEDLFSSIVASTETMKTNATSYERAASAFTSGGALTQEALDKTLEENNVNLNNIDIISQNPLGGAVALRQGGFFVAKEPPEQEGYVWEPVIGPDGINAKFIKAGQIDTEKIRIMSGNDTTFQWTKEGLFAYYFDANNSAYKQQQYIKFNGDGLSYINSDGYEYYDKEGIVRTLRKEVKRVELGWDGFFVRDVQGNNLMYFDEEGNLQLKYANIEDCYIGSLRVGFLELNSIGIKPLKGSLIRFNPADEITIPHLARPFSGVNEFIYLSYSVEAPAGYDITNVSVVKNPAAEQTSLTLRSANSISDLAANGGYYYGPELLNTLLVSLCGVNKVPIVNQSDSQIVLQVALSNSKESKEVSEIITIERSGNTTLQIISSMGTKLSTDEETVLFADINYGSVRITMADGGLSELEAIALLKETYGDNVKLLWYHYNEETESWEQIIDTRDIIFSISVNGADASVIDKYKCKLYIDNGIVGD